MAGHRMARYPEVGHTSAVGPFRRGGDRMKVVLFSGGLGLRLREYSDVVPKPMIPIGVRPILWHVMRYYAHFGHKDFVLCLGYRADLVKSYFLNYSEAISNDFVMQDGGRSLELVRTDIQDWRITFADTGVHTIVGQRLRAVRPYVGDEEFFLANYGDTLTDAPLPELIEAFRATDNVAAFLAVRPTYSFHLVEADAAGSVTAISNVREAETRINGGYFIFRREIFDYVRDGEELVEEPFRRLIAEGRLMAFKHDGFWAPMDTLKDKQDLDEMYEGGSPPWALWLREREA
jgi:glucose-1-phosphate cytidylyltransferase